MKPIMKTCTLITRFIVLLFLLSLPIQADLSFSIGLSPTSSTLFSDADRAYHANISFSEPIIRSVSSFLKFGALIGYDRWVYEYKEEYTENDKSFAFEYIELLMIGRLYKKSDNREIFMQPGIGLFSASLYNIRISSEELRTINTKKFGFSLEAGVSIERKIEFKVGYKNVIIEGQDPRWLVFTIGYIF